MGHGTCLVVSVDELMISWAEVWRSFRPAGGKHLEAKGAEFEIAQNSVKKVVFGVNNLFL